MRTFTKDPDDRLDYTKDWAAEAPEGPWLDPDDVIAASVWVVEPGTLDSDTPSLTDTTTTIWLTGGTDGQRYVVTNRITTAEGRIKDHSFIIKVEEH